MEFLAPNGSRISREVTVVVRPPEVAAVVNARDFTDRLWPGSPAGIFGKNLASGEAVAQDLSNCPTSLNGVTAVWGETPARICYVSPTQVNLFVPEEMASGGDAWLQLSRDGRESQWVRVLISKPPPEH